VTRKRHWYGVHIWPHRLGVTVIYAADGVVDAESDNVLGGRCVTQGKLQGQVEGGQRGVGGERLDSRGGAGRNQYGANSANNNGRGGGRNNNGGGRGGRGSEGGQRGAMPATGSNTYSNDGQQRYDRNSGASWTAGRQAAAGNRLF